MNQHTSKLYAPELAYQGFIVEGRPWSEVSNSLWPGVSPSTTSKARLYLEKVYRASEANKLSENIPLITDEDPDLSEPIYTPFQVQAPKPVATERSVILSDIHFPFEDKQVVRVVLNFIADYKPSHVFLNGDVIDFMAISHFDKDPKRLLKLQEEIDTVYEFLQHLREITGTGTNIVYIEGNHENRLQRYLLQHPELSSLRSMHPRILFRLDELNIRWVSQAEKEVFHGVLITHGTKVSKWSGMTARAEMDTYGCSGVSGHCHRSNLYRKTDMLHDLIWIENGCLCDLNPSYMTSTPNWQHAFTVGEFIKDDNRFHLGLVNIPKGKILYEGKLFE